jgi:predicted CoA-binding protein
MNPVIEDFLAQKTIAVAGVSRKEQPQAANLIYRKLRDAGYHVFPVNPAAERVEGDKCYENLRSLPESPDGVVIVTRPEIADELVKECVDLGIPRVWMHRSIGQGSVSAAAVARGKANGISVIAGGCPMMFCEPVDFPHRCMRWVFGLTGRVPAK